MPLDTLTEVDIIKNLSQAVDLPISEEVVKENYKFDKIISQVINFVRNKWPKYIPKDFKCWHNFKNSLSTENNSLYYRHRLAIRENLRLRTLSALHENLDGIVRMKMLARS